MNPEEAVESYIDAKKNNVSDATVQNYSYRLERLVEYLERNDIDDVSEVTPETVERFKEKRLSHAEVGEYTVRQQIRTVRDFLRWLEHKEILEQTVSNSVAIPDSDTEESATEPIDPEKAEAVVEYLYKFEYASMDHIIFHTIWETGVRLGTLLAFDVSDWDSYGRVLKARHRPNTETPLKNGRAGERNITVTDDRLAEALDDWIEVSRPNVTDDYGRKPLVATSHGRASKTTVRRSVGKVVQPCRWDNDCPHGEEIQTCEYREGNLSDCPSSESPRTVRKGSRLDALD
jgi:site-specific recombinase XerC